MKTAAAPADFSTRSAPPHDPQPAARAAVGDGPWGLVDAPPLEKPIGAKRAFLREFMKAPGQLGTCFVSSRWLAKAATHGMGVESAKVVVELGAGSGAMTDEVFRLMPKSSRFLAVELNLGLARSLKSRFPQARVYRDDAANIRTICEREGIVPGTVDTVVSSLPFLLMPDGVRGRILHEVAAVLKTGGHFSMVTYRPEWLFPSVRRFREQMEAEFGRVRDAKWVPLNVPPAYVYNCER